MPLKFFVILEKTTYFSISISVKIRKIDVKIEVERLR